MHAPEHGYWHLIEDEQVAVNFDSWKPGAPGSKGCHLAVYVQLRAAIADALHVFLSSTRAAKRARKAEDQQVIVKILTNDVVQGSLATEWMLPGSEDGNKLALSTAKINQQKKRRGRRMKED